jgi:hypothetical protein
MSTEFSSPLLAVFPTVVDTFFSARHKRRLDVQSILTRNPKRKSWENSPMRRHFCISRPSPGLFFIILLVLTTLGELKAATLDPIEASFVVQGTVPDTDFFLLTLFSSFEAGETLSYKSSTSTQHWTASLSGSYLGVGLNVAYLGNLAGFPGAPITWTSTGSYGSSVWAGSGMIAITSQPQQGFTVDLQSSLQVGAKTGSVNAMINGTFDGSAIEYRDTTGTMLVNGNPFTRAFGETLLIKISEGVYVNDFDIFLGPAPLPPLPSPAIISIYPTFPNTPGGGLCSVVSATCQIDGTLTTVPEPTSFALELIALAWALVCRRRLPAHTRNMSSHSREKQWEGE